MVGKFLVLEKLSGEKFRADMLVGDKSVRGWCLNEIEIGKPLYLFSEKDDVKIGDFTVPKEQLLTSWTSAIQSFDAENMILTTRNSTYKIEIKDEV